MELLLAGDAAATSVGKKFGVSHDSVTRHWKNHVTPERKAALLLGPLQRMELAARVAEESTSVIDHHRAVRQGLYSMFLAGVEAGDRHGASQVAGRLTDVNNSIAKLTGELAHSPLVQHNTLNVVMGSPEVQGFLTDLARLLLPWPEARRAVAEWLKDRAAPAAGLVQDSAPALEHHA